MNVRTGECQPKNTPNMHHPWTWGMSWPKWLDLINVTYAKISPKMGNVGEDFSRVLSPTHNRQPCLPTWWPETWWGPDMTHYRQPCLPIWWPETWWGPDTLQTAMLTHLVAWNMMRSWHDTLQAAMLTHLVAWNMMRSWHNTDRYAYPLGGLKHDEVQRISSQLTLDDGQGMTGGHGFQQSTCAQLRHAAQLWVKPGTYIIIV